MLGSVVVEHTASQQGEKRPRVVNGEYCTFLRLKSCGPIGRECDAPKTQLHRRCGECSETLFVETFMSRLTASLIAGRRA